MLMTLLATFGFLTGTQISLLLLAAGSIIVTGIVLLILTLRKLNEIKDKIDKLQ